jgi:hypothetical protein
MNEFTILALLSAVAASALFIALALFLVAISSTLEKIGGEEKGYGVKASLLSKIRLGVRAIETQTGMIVPQVTKLNSTLEGIHGGLGAIDTNLGGVITAVGRQEAK